MLKLCITYIYHNILIYYIHKFIYHYSYHYIIVCIYIYVLIFSNALTPNLTRSNQKDHAIKAEETEGI